MSAGHTGMTASLCSPLEAEAEQEEHIQEARKLFHPPTVISQLWDPGPVLYFSELMLVYPES